MLENNLYSVKKLRQNEVQDIFEIYNKETGETSYDYFPRTMELSLEDIMSYLD